jgi:hypothetical protein
VSELHDAIGSDLEKWVNALPADELSEGEDVGILGDWIAVVSMVSVRSDGVPVTQYYLCMKGGNMLPHAAIGLLHIGAGLAESHTGELDG